MHQNPKKKGKGTRVSRSLTKFLIDGSTCGSHYTLHVTVSKVMQMIIRNNITPAMNSEDRLYQAVWI